MEQYRIVRDGQVYSKVNLEEDGETQVTTQETLDHQVRLRGLTRRLRFATFTNVLLLAALAVVYIVWHCDGRPFTFNLSLKSVNTYAPILEKLDIALNEVIYNGTIWNEGTDVLRSETPNAELDEAWERISEVKFFSISEAEVRAMGRDPVEAVKLPSTWGRGDNIYGAYLDGQHLLHCLNHVRKMVYFPYYYEPSWGNQSSTLNMPYAWRLHTSHCIYILLQALRCQPSMALNTLQYIDRVDNQPYIDARTRRKCVNHESILKWQDEASWYTGDELSTVKAGPDSVIFQKPPEPEE